MSSNLHALVLVAEPSTFGVRAETAEKHDTPFTPVARMVCMSQSSRLPAEEARKST